MARNIAYGYNVQRALRDNPEIAEAYEVYDSCRSHQMVVYKSSKGKDTIQHLSPFPTGYSHLPDAGGILDQQVRMMAFFDAFMSGEKHAFFNPR